MSNTGFSTYVCLFLAGCFCYSNASPELSREAVNDRPVIGKSNVNREIERRLRETNILKYRANDSLFVAVDFFSHCVFTAAVFLSHRYFDSDCFR